ncbi:MAG: ABC-type multidrug transport system ATPase subunit [Chlamydiales bacterium]
MSPDPRTVAHSAVVVLDGVRKRFGQRDALVDTDLQVGAGEILGLAGPNGSGKTTLLKLLAGLLRPTAGRVRVLGLDPFARREQVMRGARFAFAPAPLYDTLSAREHLRHLSRLGTQSVPASAIDQVLELVGLEDRAADRVRTFSLGMRQRLGLALALLPEPRLLVLDEPADGLDPLAVLELRAILARLRDERGVTIVIASHLLMELEHLVDRLLVLKEGQVLFCGPPGDLRSDVEQLHARVSDPDSARQLLEARGVAAEPDGEGGLLLGGSELSLERVRDILRAGGVDLFEYGARRPGLEVALIARLEQGQEPVR